MPVDRYEAEYNMSHRYRGQALIFNNVIFDDPELQPRYSSNADAETLNQTLKELHFEVNIYKDYNCYQIKTILENITKVVDHSESDCILIGILSHGGHGYVYAKDFYYKLDTIYSMFTAENCPSLAGKPKVFFIQACQGKQLDGGFMMENRTQRDGGDSMMGTQSRSQTDGDSMKYFSYSIPNYADFLIAQSTMPGYASWRGDNGSWFIQSLCKELNKNGKRHNILQLLTSVNQKVAIDCKSSCDRPEFNNKKQIPCTSIMLTRMLIFTEK